MKKFFFKYSLRELAEFVKFVKFADDKNKVCRFKVFSYLCSLK